MDFGEDHLPTGYEFDFVDPLSSEKICSICRNALRNPVQLTSCGHRFCKICLESWVERCWLRIFAFLVTEALLLHVVLFSLRRRKNVGIKFLKKNNSVSFRSSMHLSSKLCTDRRISSLIYTFQGTFKQLMSIRSEAYSGKRRGELTNKQNWLSGTR